MAGPHSRASSSPFATHQRSFLLHSTTQTRLAIIAALLVVSFFLVLPQSTRELLFHTGTSPESLSPSAFPGREAPNATPAMNFHEDADVEHVTRSPLVPLTVLADLDDDGAVCLDGSPPAIHLSPGWGRGANNWLIYLEGGGWCNSEEECAHRAATHLGSSKRMGGLMAFGGILSHDPTVNPGALKVNPGALKVNPGALKVNPGALRVNPGALKVNPGALKVNPGFYNWNLVFVRYCDGASYLGDTNEPVQTNNGLVFFRGRRIFDAVTRYLVSHHGMGAASLVLLSGCSAGGLASLQHCDRLAEILQQSSSQSGTSERAGAEEGRAGGGAEERVMEGRGRVGGGPVVKCMGDAGFFLDSEDNVSLHERCTAAAAPQDHSLVRSSLRRLKIPLQRQSSLFLPSLPSLLAPSERVFA
ncbi:unnamed protein product [Closterium sp. Naga37s-1]|nr:unnamed protein product [Closterium sp. Naga37s-1]